MAYNGAGIYGLYNVMEHKVYIGQSKHIAQRFASHRANFRAKSDAMQMYQEPLENFAFCVLEKMTDAEFEKYGDMMECVYIEQAKDLKFDIYNKQKTTYGIHSVFWAFDTREKFRNAIIEQVGTKPGYISRMCEESRRRVVEGMNAARKGA